VLEKVQSETKPNEIHQHTLSNSGKLVTLFLNKVNGFVSKLLDSLLVNLTVKKKEKTYTVIALKSIITGKKSYLRRVPKQYHRVR
jgi:hypothetical protein